METGLLFDTVNEKIEVYTENINVENDNLTVGLRPQFDSEGNINNLKYFLETKEEEELLETRMNFETTLNINQNSYKDFLNWKDQFNELYTGIELDCETEDFISLADNVIDNLYKFGEMARVEKNDVLILVDLVRLDDSWAVDYNARTTSRIDRNFKLDDRMFLDDYEDEQVINECYPIWVKRMDEEFGDVRYTEVEKLNEYFKNEKL